MGEEQLYNGVLIRPGEFMVRCGSAIGNMMMNRLRESVERTLRKTRLDFDVKIVEGVRIVIRGERRSIDWLMLSEKMARIFGVSSTSPIIIVPGNNLSILISRIVELIESTRAKTFSIRFVTPFKNIDSLALTKAIAGHVLEKVSSWIDLVKPEIEIHVEHRDSEFYVTDRFFPGVGGLPYGSEGCLVVLASGGIDSAYASWMAMKRGVRIIPVFIDLGPYWSNEAKKRFKEYLEILYNEWIPWDTLKSYIVYGAEQIILKASIPSRLRCLFCKANMYRLAALIALREGCKGIVTGEAVGQVASQTLRNLYILSRLAPLPVFRPIAFMDKLEIINNASRLGFNCLNRRVGSCVLCPETPETSATDKDLKILRKALDDTYEDSIRLIKENTETIILRP